jgi:hypothetical protein
MSQLLLINLFANFEEFHHMVISSMLQLEEGTVDLFSKTVKEDGLTIDMEVAEKPRTINVYIQAWHNRTWEHGFMGIFKGKDSYSKTKAFKD